MSTVSALSSMREKSVAELTQELASVRAMVKSLNLFLLQLRKLKNDLREMNNKYQELSNINSQFVDLIDQK